MSWRKRTVFHPNDPVSAPACGQKSFPSVPLKCSMNFMPSQETSPLVTFSPRTRTSASTARSLNGERSTSIRPEPPSAARSAGTSTTSQSPAIFAKRENRQADGSVNAAASDTPTHANAPKALSVFFIFSLQRPTPSRFAQPRRCGASPRPTKEVHRLGAPRGQAAELEAPPPCAHRTLIENPPPVTTSAPPVAVSTR